MAAPTVAARNNSVTATPITNHTVNLPSGIVSGDLLLLHFASDNNFSAMTVTLPGGWTKILDTFPDAEDIATCVAWREADGTEGATISVTTSQGEHAVHRTWRITGAEDPDTQAPEIARAGVTNDSSPDPPNLTPTGGAKDYLWIACENHEDGNVTNTGYPANYNDGQLAQAAAGFASTSYGSYAERTLNAASENPGTFSLSGSSPWNAVTIAVHPPAAPTLTAEERRSISGIWLPLIPGVTPNASKDQEWRQQSAWSYSGILAGGPIAPPVGPPPRGGFLVTLTDLMKP